MKPYLVLPVLLLFNYVHAQSVSPLAVPASPGTYSRLFVDAFSIINNPASLVCLKNFTAGVYAGQRFMVAELKHGVLSAGLPLHNAGIGVHINYLKAGAFTQTEFGLAYAKTLGQIDIGARFNYHTLSVQGYGAASCVVADVGALWHIAENLHTGIHLYNPVRAKFGKGEERLGYVYSAGLGYEVSAQLLLSVIIKKEENKPPGFFIAVHYEPAARVLLQAGIATATAEAYLSIGFQLSGWRLLCAVSYHARLGISPALSLMYKP